MHETSITVIYHAMYCMEMGFYSASSMKQQSAEKVEMSLHKGTLS